jgi:hypothetical protein
MRYRVGGVLIPHGRRTSRYSGQGARVARTRPLSVAFAATHSQWDPEYLLEESYDVERLLALFEESNRLHALA